MVYDPNLWYIHGNTYDLLLGREDKNALHFLSEMQHLALRHEFVDKHPGGRMALLTGDLAAFQMAFGACLITCGHT